MDTIQKDALNAALAGATYNDLVGSMMAAADRHKELKAEQAEAWEVYSHIARSIIPNRMDADQIQNITVILPDGSKKQLLVIDSVSVKTPKENKGQLWAWLREHDAAEIISETVNASTLSAYVREQMKLGEPYPVDICEVSMYSTASLRKAS